VRVVVTLVLRLPAVVGAADEIARGLEDVAIDEFGSAVDPQVARRRMRRLGKRKTAVAVGHPILVICWHLLTNNCEYDDLGGDWFARPTDTDKRRDQLIRQLPDLGYGVTVTNLAA
jgi:hypothetical protein